jgi:hypothetical protein
MEDEKGKQGCVFSRKTAAQLFSMAWEPRPCIARRM